MNKDQVKGRLDQARGKVKEAAGHAVDNDRLKGRGKAEQVRGKTRAAIGDGKEKVKDAIDKL